MFTPFRRGLLGLLALALLAPAARVGAAPPTKDVEEILSWVPPDAALFVHVDVAALWKSKPVESFRKENPGKFYDQFLELSEAVGIKPEDVRTLTIFMPKLKGPGDQQGVCFAFTLAKPYSGKQVVAALNALAEIKKIPEEFGFKKFKKEREGVYAIEEPSPPLPKGAKPIPTSKTLFLFDNPNRIVILGPKGSELAKPHTGAKTGAISEALAAATEGKTIGFGLNFANLPDEIRQENLPPQVEPFKPLIHSDAIIGTAVLTDELTVNVAIKAGTRPKALEAEKSLGVFKTLMQTLLSVGIVDLKKDETNAKLVGLANVAADALKSMKIASDDSQATASLTAKTDFDLSPIYGLFARTGQAAARASTTNNLKQHALAMHGYHDTYNGMPAAAILGKKGKPLLSWRVAILPYIEQDNLYKQFKLDEPWDSEHNKKLLENNPMPRVFEVVGTTKPGEKNTHFQVFRSNGAMFDLVQGYKLQNITDGTSNTFMVATAKTAVPWTKPDDIEYDAKKEPHDWLLWTNDVSMVAFGDGSVRAIAKKVKAASLHAYITRGGGEVVDE